MIEYPKIDTVFERDMQGTKKLIYGKFRNQTVEYLKDCQWSFTEKVDGTNVRVHWNGHRAMFAGRTDNAQMPMHLLNVLTELFGGDMNEEVFEQKFGENEVTLYGEGYGEKIQKGGGLYRKGCGFILFDVLIGNNWLERHNVVDIAQTFNIPVVPVVMTGTVMDGVDYVRKNPVCSLAEELKPAEGLVARPMVELRDIFGKRVIFKVKAKDFSS